MEGLAPEKHQANLWLTSAVAGLAFHALIQPIDTLDVLVWQMLGIFAAAAASVFYVDVQVFGLAPLAAAKVLAVFATGFTLSLTASMLAYRVFFHRLRRFAGPVAARLTKLWSVWKSSQGFKYNLVVYDLHRQYGDIVRTGPRELSIARASALPQIASLRKTVFYQYPDWKQARLGMLETRDLDDHRRRRKPWEKALALPEIAKYDAAMQSTISLFLDGIACERGQRVNVTDWTAMLAYDLMGVIGFGRDFGSLRAGKESAAIGKLRAVMRSFGLLFPVPWAISLLAHTPGTGGAMGPFDAYCRDLVAGKREEAKLKKAQKGTEEQQQQQQQQPRDVISWLIRAYDEGGPAGAPTLAALNSDTRALVIAGADTTYGTLTNAFYYLAAHPHTYAALQAAVDAACPGGEAAFSHERVKNVPLLDAVINETLRLKPATPNGTPRLTPPEGLRLASSSSDGEEAFIPGNVHVWMPQWVIHRDERYYERPLEWVPERWIAGGEKAGMVKDRAAFFPFQIGTFACVGKQLAYWEMRSVLARMALRYDIRFASAQDGKDFDEKQLNTWTLAPPPLGMCFRERRLRGKKA